MLNIINLHDNNITTKVALNTLMRAINHTQGDFSLILACCNSIKYQQLLRQWIKTSSPVAVQELILSPETETLYTTIKTTIGNQQPPALMVCGLETVVAINQLLISTNIVRDEFSKQFHFPLILWVNDDILRALIKLAPDFKNWAANTIRFHIPNPQVIELEVITA